MKKLILALVVFASVCAYAQKWDTITATNASCVIGSCSYINVPDKAATLTVVVTGTFNATLQFESSADAGTTLKNEGSTTGTGTFTFSVAAKNWFQVRASAYTSGSATIKMLSSTATNGLPSGVTSDGGTGLKGGAFACTSDCVVTYTDNHTLAATDNGKILLINKGSDVTITVPAGLPIGFSCLIVQLGAGAAIPTASSTTIHQQQSFTKTAGQYAIATLVSYATDVYVLGGDLQ